MPDFGLLELLGGFGLGDALGLGSLFGAGEAAADVGLGAGLGAGLEGAAATVPFDIGTATGFGAGADAAATAAGATGLASGLGDTAGLSFLGPTVGATAAETLGAGAGGLDAATGFGEAANIAANAVGDSALPSASTLTSGTLGDLTTKTAFPGVSGTGPIATPASIGPLGTTAPAASTPVAPVGSATSGAIDLTSVDPSLITDAGGAGKATTGASFLDKLSPSNLASGAVDQVSKNPLGLAAGLGALGVGLMGNKKPAGTAQLGNIAAQQGAQGQQLQQYLTSGTLPAGMQASVDAATKAAKAKIVANYAGRGLPTDPTKNSSLAQELANVDQNAIITTAQLGQQLLTTGLDETKLSADVYNKLVGIDQTEQAQVQAALANFAKGLGGGGINLKLA